MTFLETVICLIILRCDSYLSSIGTENSLEKFPVLSKFVEGLEDSYIKRWSLVTASVNEDTGIELNEEEKRYLRLLSVMDNDNVMQSLLDLCMAVFTFPEFDAYLTHHFGYSVNMHLSFLLEGIGFPAEELVIKKLETAETICNVDRSTYPLQYAPLSIDEKVYIYLSGRDDINPRLERFTVKYRPEDISGENKPFVNEETIKKGADFLASGGRVLQICGRGGRRFAARHIASGLNKEFLFVNIADLFSVKVRKDLQGLRSVLTREAELDNAGICLYGITDSFLTGGVRLDDKRKRQDLEMLENMLFIPIIKKDIPLILISDAPAMLIRSLTEKEYRIAELPEKLDYSSRLKLWKGFKKFYKLGFSPEDMADRYHLNASESAGVIKSFLERREEEKTAPEDDLFTRISMERLDDGALETGRVVYPAVRLNDVKVKSEIRGILNDVVNSVRSSSTILDKWGLRGNYPYGRCVSLLLSGPPGTGKTMTANAIAGELKLPLYQVNLSNIVDKYIGETEKNLEKAFTFAEKTNTILFFDEADSLFGVRSEVHDSKDRYANTEISYLLQRIEAYDGIVIMATNIKGNIDPAFIRRIRYVVNFENPDEELRREIWESCINDSIPHDEIDVSYLASQFDKFTGSIIKTVFLNACAYAAGKDENLGMKHLVHAIRQELEKTSSVTFTMDTLGKYAYLL